MPAGVHDNGPGRPMTSLPRFTGWIPSTSLAGSIEKKGLLLVETRRKGELKENRVNRRVGVETEDDFVEARPAKHPPRGARGTTRSPPLRSPRA